MRMINTNQIEPFLPRRFVRRQQIFRTQLVHRALRTRVRVFQSQRLRYPLVLSLDAPQHRPAALIWKCFFGMRNHGAPRLLLDFDHSCQNLSLKYFWPPSQSTVTTSPVRPSRSNRSATRAAATTFAAADTPTSNPSSLASRRAI